MKRICIVMPAYNESRVIAEVIKKTKKVCAKTKDCYIDLVVINDDSKDDTSDIAKKSGAIVVDHIINLGAGGATLTGLAYAREYGYDIVASMDADGQHDPEDVLSGIKKMMKNEADLLIGSRLINSEGMSRAKIVGNKGLSLITRLLFGISVTDSQSGLRIYSKRAISELTWRSTGYEFCSEMIWRAKQLNISIVEYPIQAIYTDYSCAKGQNNWNAINIIRRLLKQRLLEIFE